MDNDIVLEPGAGPTSSDTDTTKPMDTDMGSVEPPEAKYMPEQVFDVSSDLKISPVISEAAGPIQYEDSKFKKTTVDPLDHDVKDIGVPPAAPSLQQTLEPTIATVSPPSSYPYVKEAEKTLPGLSPVRTYAGDVAHVMTEKGTSTADMVMAENQRETGNENTLTGENEEPSHAGKKAFFAIFSLILIGAGVVGAYYLYTLSPLAPATPVVQPVTKVASLVPADKQITVAVDGLSSRSALTQLKVKVAEQSAPNTITEIIPYVTTNTVKMRVTTADMIKLMDISAPDMLARSLTPSWMLGVYTDGQNNKNIFVVTTNNFFQNAFAGMLSWESVMSDDLKQYLYPTEITGIANTLNFDSILPTSIALATSSATTTSALQATTSARIVAATSSMKISSTTSATSTPAPAPVIPYFTLRGQFVDKIVRNKDVREFVTADGKTLFLYSFVANNMMAITPNEATLAEIITRLDKQAFVR